MVADIGHVHLKVADLDRAVRFYRDVLGMTVKNQIEGAAFLAFGRYHHHVALNTWESAGGSPPGPESTGLYHFAIRFGTRRGFAEAVRRLLDAGVTIDSTSDSGGAAECVYLRDPDQNGVELTWDRPASLRAAGPSPERSLDLDELLAELAR